MADLIEGAAVAGPDGSDAKGEHVGTRPSARLVDGAPVQEEQARKPPRGEVLNRTAAWLLSAEAQASLFTPDPAVPSREPDGLTEVAVIAAALWLTAHAIHEHTDHDHDHDHDLSEPVFGPHHE